MGIADSPDISRFSIRRASDHALSKGLLHSTLRFRFLVKLPAHYDVRLDDLTNEWEINALEQAQLVI